MLAVFVIALLFWVPASRSTPSSCEDLIRPLDHVKFHELEGRWALVAGSLSDPSHLEPFKSRDSATIQFSQSSNASEIVFTRAFSYNDTCQYWHQNITSEEFRSLTFSGFSTSLFKTSCQNCILMKFNSTANAHHRLYLFSRGREVEQEVREELTAQTACLNMTQPVWMDRTKELCPEQKAIDPATKN